MAQAGLDPVAGYTPSCAAPAEAVGRRDPDDHPDDAGPRGIAAGDEVRVANARGAFIAVADVSDRVRPGVVASTKGRWPGDSKQGATVNATVDEREADMSSGAVFHDNRVRVDRTA